MTINPTYRIKLPLLLLVAAMAFFVSCQQEGVENRVTFNYMEVESTSTGMFISIESSEEWRITIDEEGSQWCSVTPESGTGSRNNIVLSYSENTDTVARTAVIRVTFGGGEVITTEFVQLGKAPEDPGEPDDPDNPDYSELVFEPVYDWLELPEVVESEGHAYVFHHASIGGTQVRNYSIYYDAENRIALWVAYPLCDLYMGSGRTDDWNYDPKIPNSFQPQLFSGWPEGGYDRGHQIPSGSRNSDRGDLNRQTFYFSNMTAQVSSFNQGLWANVETKIRGYASTCDTLYVVTGPILATEDDPQIDYTTDNAGNQVAIPKAYFKVLLKYNIDEGTYYSIGYYYENREYDRRNPQESDLYRVSEIEDMTGINFFTNLPDNIENDVKQQYEPNRWGF